MHTTGTHKLFFCLSQWPPKAHPIVLGGSNMRMGSHGDPLGPLPNTIMNLVLYMTHS